MTDVEELKGKLKTQLAILGDDKTKEWWENYVKHHSKFRGVGIPKIREKLKEWYKQESIADFSIDQQLDLALSFFAEEYAEDKLSGILFHQIYLNDKLDYRILLPKIEEIFKKQYIYDWNICDWLCVRVLGPMIEKYGISCARAISKWNNAANLWQARCSIVAFANLAKEDIYTSLLLESCKILIRREERFAKTGVGWILRELSKVNEGLVIQFVRENKRLFSKESLENAIKYFKKDDKMNMRVLVFSD